MTKSSRHLTAASIVIALLLLTYVGFLLFTNYTSQVNLQKTILAEYAVENDRRAANIAHFLAVRRDDVINLSLSREISVFFENRALGMSMQYGLKQSLPPIKQRFMGLINRHRIGTDTAYLRIIFLDEDGRLLVDERAPDFRPALDDEPARWKEPEHRSAAILTNDQRREIVVSLAYYFKGTYSGQIAAWVRPGFLHDYVMADTRNIRSSSFLLSPGGSVFVPVRHQEPPDLGDLMPGPSVELKADWHGETGVRLVAHQTRVPDSPFLLLTVVEANDLFGRIDPRGLLISMGVLAALIIIATVIIIRTKTRSLVLQTRLETSLRHEQEVSDKNRQLEAEMAERRQAEEALRRSEERYRTLIETSPDVIYSVSSEGAIATLNSAFEKITGWTRISWIGRPFLHIIHPDDHETARKMFEGLMEGEPLLRYELRCLTRNGEYRTAEFTSTGLKEGDRIVGSFGIARDITERKKLEEQLRQAVKMQAVGQLAGGIAHDFNNMLSVIIGYCNILSEDMKEDDPLRSHVDLISSSAERAAQLTQNLLAFSRKQILNMQAVDLNVTVHSVRHLITRLIGEDVTVTFDLSGDSLKIMADAAQVGQVIMNLAANSRDAMPHGGRLTISTARLDMDADFKRKHGFGRPGPYAVVSVADTGVGMDDLTRERIFEPFYTTKDIGKGTGLGLAIVFGIVKQHRGYIEVESTPGRGTAFTIYLPLNPHAAKEEGTERVQPQPRGGTETILVAEDNEDVRGMIRRVLSGAGYTVIEAADGREAVAMFRSHADQVRLLLFDVVMPGKNGKEAFEEIKTIRSGMKCLFLSGYTADIISRSGVTDSNGGFIQKPVTASVLLRRIREMLDVV